MARSTSQKTDNFETKYSATTIIHQILDTQDNVRGHSRVA